MTARARWDNDRRKWYAHRAKLIEDGATPEDAERIAKAESARIAAQRRAKTNPGKKVNVA